ncbi:DUF72 domain-containing protein [Stutzerimonas zhaodongensis]|uniref:DUF72 domain-containing protein n=1 Tax=Stutzerimonas TaxID=2901164 RepID=UPI003890D1D0
MSVQSDGSSVLLGTAGWSLPRKQWLEFPAQGTLLQRYAGCFSAVEINSAFYRPHRPATYAKWGESVPLGFRFCVKVPKQITHERRLADCTALVDQFLHECGHLGEKLGCLLVQLPPSLDYEPHTASAFIDSLRARYAGPVAVEPRHQSWVDAEPLLQRARIARVAADPAPFEGATEPGGWQGFSYYRLHGSPRIYHSSYGDAWLDSLAQRLRAQAGTPSWCIFDNTASGAATADALALQRRFKHS